MVRIKRWKQATDPATHKGCVACSTFLASTGFVTQIDVWPGFLYPQIDLPDGLGYGYPKSRVAIERGDADLDFGNLPVEAPRHEAFDAIHPIAGKSIPRMVF